MLQKHVLKVFIYSLPPEDNMAALPNDAFKDAAIVHRICFAARSLPVGCPNYWNLTENCKDHSVSSEEARVFVENLKVLCGDVFMSDITLMNELIKLPKSHNEKVERIGIVLISQRANCQNAIVHFIHALTERHQQ